MGIDDTVRLDTRLAGQLRRYHTWPITGQQTVAEHTWQMLRIYTSVALEINPAMVFRIMFHDIGEHATGDLPYPVKRDNPDLKAQIDMLEQRSYITQLDHWDALTNERAITDDEGRLMKHIELVEMAEFGLDQMCLGNHHGVIIANRCLEAVYKIQPPPCARLAHYVITRLRLFYQQYTSKVGCPLNDWWLIDPWSKLNESK